MLAACVSLEFVEFRECSVLLVRRRYMSPSLSLASEGIERTRAPFLHLPPFLLEPIAIALLFVSSIVLSFRRYQNFLPLKPS